MAGRQLNLPPSGEVGDKYLRPKDSNAAVEICDRATRKMPGPQGYDKQTNKLSEHYSKIESSQSHIRFSSGFPYAPLKAMLTRISK